MSLDHTLKQFDEELLALNMQVARMAALAEKQFELAIEVLGTGDPVMMKQIIETEGTINRLEIDADEAASQLIAKRQPTAGDLRMITSIIKTITDLERVGDEAKKITLRAKQLHGRRLLKLKNYSQIRLVSNLALNMLRSSVHAFVERDVSVAPTVIACDDEVNLESQAIMRTLVAMMLEDPRTISEGIDLIMVTKSIERIGDHAKNISEHVVYMVSGKDVRHVSAAEIRRQIDA